MPHLTTDRVQALLGAARGLLRGAISSVVLTLAPVPASRPRVMRNGGVYHMPRYAEFLAACGQQLAKHGAPQVDVPVMVIVDVACAKPAAGKLDHPMGDVDNFAKGPLDAMTRSGTFWHDDRQIGALFVTKRYTEPGEEPHVRIDVAPL